MVPGLAVADDVTAQPTAPTPRVKRGIPHLPGLDGLRGLAVLGVVFFHANGLLPGGYLGVDLFFVLSGYLITSILLAEVRDTGRVDLAHFWVRRARRLFPALLSLMPAVALYAVVFAKPDELASLRGDALATLGYVANWRAVFSQKSYWQLFAAPSPLEHTWSLAIEEQFYVVWPLLFTLVLVVLRRGRRVMLGVTLVLLGLSVVAMLHAYDPDATSRAYFRTDTRAAAILAGAVLALTFPPSRDLGARLGAKVRVLDVLGFVALAGTTSAWLALDGQSPFLYHGGFWLTELACLALIACAVCGPASFVARGLSFRPLAYVGTISYGVYLWHWPVDCVLTLERTHLREPWLEMVRLAVTFGIAVTSYRYLERPIRVHGLTFARARFVVPSAFAGAALVVVWATFPRATPKQVAPRPPMKAILDTLWPTPYSVDSHTLPPASALPPGTLRILTLGDSVAGKLGVALRYRQESAHAFVAERGVGNCSILRSQIFHAGHTAGKQNDAGGCAAHWASDVREVKPDVTLIVLGGAYLAKIDQDGKYEWSCDAGWQQAYRARLEELIAAMGKDAGQVVITLVPYPLGRWRARDTVQHVDCFNGLLASVAAAHHFPTVDVARHVCPTPDCVIFSDGEPIRPDGLHPDGKGAEETARWTLAEIRRQVAAR